jgi:hypothetical protein
MGTQVGMEAVCGIESLYKPSKPSRIVQVLDGCAQGSSPEARKPSMSQEGGAGLEGIRLCVLEHHYTIHGKKLRISVAPIRTTRLKLIQPPWTGCSAGFRGTSNNCKCSHAVRPCSSAECSHWPSAKLDRPTPGRGRGWPDGMIPAC